MKAKLPLYKNKTISGKMFKFSLELRGMHVCYPIQTVLGNTTNLEILIRVALTSSRHSLLANKVSGRQFVY